jgi:hypothetical protein
VSDRVILRVKFTLAAAPATTRKAVGGFLRYVQYRDQHQDSAPAPAPQREVEGMLKYVAHRDRGVPRGRLFGPAGVCGDQERKELTAYVARSLRATAPNQERQAGARASDRRRAVYRFVISPEAAPGLDLQRLTAATVAQLESDLGGRLRWIAAEHRNTDHPHVHLVVAGIREVGRDRLKSWMLTGPRLARMKGALALEIERQRGLVRGQGLPVSPVQSEGLGLRRGTQMLGSVSPLGRASAEPRGAGRQLARLHPRAQRSAPQRRAPAPLTRASARPSPYTRLRSIGLHRLAARYRRDLERQADEDRRARDRERTR